MGVTRCATTPSGRRGSMLCCRYPQRQGCRWCLIERSEPDSWRFVVAGRSRSGSLGRTRFGPFAPCNRAQCRLSIIALRGYSRFRHDFLLNEIGGLSRARATPSQPRKPTLAGAARLSPGPPPPLNRPRGSGLRSGFSRALRSLARRLRRRGKGFRTSRTSRQLLLTHELRILDRARGVGYSRRR